jgi:hypothetical protein
MLILTSKKIFTKLLRGYTGISIWPFIILRDSEHEIGKDAYTTLINHERIHLRQQIETLIVPFYILYAFFYIRNRIKGLRHFQAYQMIPFEQESYANETNLKYLATRKLWQWRKYT